MRGNLATTLALHGTAAGGQTDTSSFIGRKYVVRDTKYGHGIGEYDTPDQAEKASLARPYSKVTSQPDIAQTPKVRDIARKRLVRMNPDVDAGGIGSGRHKTSTRSAKEQMKRLKRASQQISSHPLPAVYWKPQQEKISKRMGSLTYQIRKNRGR